MQLKRNALLILLILMGSFCFAQNTGNENDDEWDVNPNLHFGIKAGFTLSTIISAELSDPIIKPGMVVGLSCNYIKAKKYLWQMEVNGSFRGANFSYDSAASLNRFSLFYLDVPLMFHLGIGKKKKFWPFIGIQPSLVIRKDAYKSDEIVPQPVDANIKGYDLGVIAGLHYKVSETIGFQLLLHYGFLNFNRRLTLPFYPYLGKGEPMYNRSIQFCLVFKV